MTIERTVFLCLAFSLLFFCSCLTDVGHGENQTTSNNEVVPGNLKWSERMALSIMERHPEAWQTENDTLPEWNYKIGLLMTAFEKLYEKTNNEKYFNYMKEYAETVVDESGNILNYQVEEYNIDNINAGKFLFDLHEKTKDDRYLTAMKTLRSQLEGHPRTNGGGFWHKKIYPYQMWLDGLYMGTPFYARYNVTFEKGDKIDDIIHQYEQIQAHHVDEETGLLYHGWDESKQMPWADKETGRSPGFWSRALGWYAMAMVDVLDYIPQEHPKRELIIGHLNSLAETLVKYQDEKTGLWYQVPDKPNGKGNYLESSSSSMFAYALGKGSRMGYLPAEYREVAEKCFQGLINELIKVDPNGEVHITQVCKSAGLGGNPYRDGSYEYYVGEIIKVDNLHGLGPFILAAVELDQ